MPPKKALRRSQDERYDWINDVSSSSSITPLHRRKAAGLVGWTPCPVHHAPVDYSPTALKREERESTIDSNYQSKRDPNCTAKKCAKNPRCYNHLGIDQALKQTKEEFVLDKLGDPPERRVEDQPAGLRNLGATCYANAFLQVWFRNVGFRNGVYKAAQSAAPNSPMYHLAMIFALLQFSKRAVVDPTPLIDCLGFDKAIQQDATEFQKLFTEYIAETFRRQSDPAVKDVLSDLFEGELTNVTKCLKCGRQSERTQSFLEMDINLTNNATLDECIANSFQTERLTGDNKYRCASCSSLQEAERWTVMRTLPPVLNFTLMRFKYTAGKRVKSKAKIKYSRSMLLGDVVWKLKAAVIHIGTSAHHGHFVCDVYDEELGRWVSCNDEIIEEPPNPAKRRKTFAPDDYITCDQVYMLIYQKEDSGPAEQPPEDIMRQVEMEDARFEYDMDERAVKKERLEDEFAHLHGAKKDVLMSVPGDDVALPNAELTRWIKAKKVDDLFRSFDYSAVKCQHGGLDPEKGEACHLISEDAWDKLGAYDPGLTEMQPCAICVEEEYDRRKGKSSLVDQIATFDEANASLDEQEYMISKKWIDLWRKGDVGNKSPSDAPFSLFCQHGNRWDKDHKSIRITGEALMLLRSIFGDFNAYTVEEPMCGQCAEDFAGDEETLIDFNKQRKEEQGLMRKWVKTPNQPVVFHEDFYLLPNGWYDGWHVWNNGGGTVPRPNLDMGICEHEKLNWDPTTEPARYTSKAGWREITARYGNVSPVMIRFGSDAVPPGKKNSIYHLVPDVCEPCRVKKAGEYETTKITIVIGTETSFGTKNTAMGRGRVTRNKAMSWDMEITKNATVKDIKVEIYNSLQVSPISQKIRYKGRVLESDETMASAGILSRDVVFCEIIEEEDEFPVEVGTNEGFAGSILVGNVSCPTCTFLQRAGNVNCEVCLLPMDNKALVDLS